MRALMLVLALLFTQVDTSGTTYEERLAYGQQFIAESARIAHEHCGEPYFGTICE